jgi:hypothetical protein
MRLVRANAKTSTLQLFQRSLDSFIRPFFQHYWHPLGFPSQSLRTFSLDVLTLSDVHGYYSVWGETHSVSYESIDYYRRHEIRTATEDRL